jgi:HEAT repeat protein
MAAEELSKQSHPDAVAALEQVLRKESEFWAVRSAAAEGLGKMQTESALRALLRAEKEGLGQPRVLAALVQGLGGYAVSPEAHAAVLKYAREQKSLDVETAAVFALARMRASPELVEKGLKVLQAAAQKPTRRAVRAAAFRALTVLEDPRTFETVLKLAQPGQTDELSNRSIQVLGRLGRHDSLRDRTRAALTAWLDDPDRSAQEAAAFALGALGDPRAIPDLERVRGSARAEGVRQFAAAAIQAIRRPEDPKRAPAALLERLAAVEKRNQELQRQVKELSDRLDALKKAPQRKADKPKGKQ